MADINHIIEPERHGLWIAVTFILALLALVAALVVKARSEDMMAATQLEILHLNQKIEALHSKAAAPVATPTPAPMPAPAPMDAK